MYKKGFIRIWLVLIYIICLNSGISFAKETTGSIFPRTVLQFKILESEFSEGNYLTGNMSDLGFIPYNYKETSNTRPANDRMLTLRSEFTVDSIYSNSDLYIVLLPIDYSCKIFLNGVQLLIRGDFKFAYTNRIHNTEKILLPHEILKYNQVNETAIQLYPKEGEVYPVSQVFIANAKDADQYTFYRNLVGTKLIFALSLSGFVFFIFYLIIYISRREYQKQHFLFFAFMNLFFVISYSNNIFTHDFSHTLFLEKFARAGFPLFIFVGICFLLEYTNLFKSKRLIKLVLAILYLPSVIMVLVPGTTTEVIKAYNTYPLISLLIGNFILFVLTFLFFLREKDLRSTFLFVIFFLNIISGFHDGYYFAVLKIKPFVLFTPITVFGINMIIFFILALDHSKLYHVALSSSEKLGKMNQELELLVEKRTQKTIEYANKLEEANNTKDKFFSIIAHDLKNPFNTLIGYSDMLKTEFREYNHEEIEQQLKIIYETSVKGYDLLENLLQWSQTQTDKIVFEPVKINLHDLAQYCIDDIEHQSYFKGIEMYNQVAENFHIIADKNLLKTVLRNLINNAVKFTHRNGMVTIGSKRNNDTLEIWVKDTGIGMTDAELQSIFRIDKVLSKSGTNREKGSGLGLILCKEFVEKHGGKIWAETEVNTGSIFKFTIPKIIQLS